LPRVTGLSFSLHQGLVPWCFVLRGAGKAQGAGKRAGKAQDRGSGLGAAFLGSSKIIVYNLKFLFAFRTKLV